MTINDMRLYILDAYPNSSWKFRNKVLCMPTNQIVAIYHSIVERKEKQDQTKIGDKEDYHQFDIFEWSAYKNELENGKGTHTQVKED